MKRLAVGKAFYGGHIFTGYKRHFGHTEGHSLAVNQAGAGLADVSAATVLRTGYPQLVTQHPQQSQIGRRFDIDGLAIDVKTVIRHGLNP